MRLVLYDGSFECSPKNFFAAKAACASTGLRRPSWRLRPRHLRRSRGATRTHRRTRPRRTGRLRHSRRVGAHAQPRPFPFFPLLDSAEYAERHLGELPVDKIVYRCVHRLPRADFLTWLHETRARPQRSISVLVGAPSRNTTLNALKLSEANLLTKESAPELLLGGIAIAERHATRGDEHERLFAKMVQGCRFFVSQTVYDASSTKSLLSDYALLLAAKGLAPVPIIFTFAPCGSVKTLEFMKWLGITFPRILAELHSALLPADAACCARHWTGWAVPAPRIRPLVAGALSMMGQPGPWAAGHVSPALEAALFRKLDRLDALEPSVDSGSGRAPNGAGPPTCGPTSPVR